MQNDQFRMPNGETGQARQVLFIRHSPFVIRHFFSVRLCDGAEIRPAATTQSFASSDSGRRTENQTTCASAQTAACANERGFSACFHAGAAQR